MHARITTAEITGDQLDDALPGFRDEILPSIQALSGFKGHYTLADRTSGKVLFITLWESEDAMNASETVIGPLRAKAFPNGAAVEAYEVVTQPELDEGQRLLAALMQAKQDIEAQAKRLASSDEVSKLLRGMESSIKAFEEWARRRGGPPPTGSV